MKRNTLIKLIIAALLITGVAFISCDKNPAGIDQADNAAPGSTQQSLGAFGFEINDDAGTLTLFVNGEPVSLGKSGDGGYKVLANINAEVDLTDIDYTPQGCPGANPGAMGKTSGVAETRILGLTFTKKANGGTLSDISTNGLSTTNIGGANAIIDLGDNSIADSETFSISYEVILVDCAVFSIYFNLDGTLTP